MLHRVTIFAAKTLWLSRVATIIPSKSDEFVIDAVTNCQCYLFNEELIEFMELPKWLWWILSWVDRTIYGTWNSRYPIFQRSIKCSWLDRLHNSKHTFTTKRCIKASVTKLSFNRNIRLKDVYESAITVSEMWIKAIVGMKND